MKIPQRDDQVRLDAPQTQAGRAVQPVEGSLGDSYIKTMQGLTKQFDEISKMQFDLSENAIKGQLNAFNIYVDSRTKQYHKDLELATTQEQIKGLYDQYSKDIAENGNNVLGNNIYQEWDRVKGGATRANAEYAGAVANTVLLKKQNKELAITSLDALNREAGNAANPEEEKAIRQQAYNLITENVNNQTFDAATGEKLRRQFDYELDKTQIERDIFDDPENAIKKLHTNKYAPAVSYPERQKFIHNAEKEIASRSGTSKGIARELKNDWLIRYSSNDWTKDANGNIINKQRDLAYKIYDMSAEQPLEAARLYAKELGLDASKVNADDAIAFRTFMLQAFDFNDQARNDAFNQAYDTAVETVNELKTYKNSKGSFSLQRNPLAFVMGYNNPEVYTQLDTNSMDKFISSYYTVNDMFKDTYSRALMAKNETMRDKLQEQNRMIADLIVSDLDKGYFDKAGYYGNMQDRLNTIKNQLLEHGVTFSDKNRQMRNVVMYLLNNYRVEDLFSGKTEEEEIQNAMSKAFTYALKPADDFSNIAIHRIAYGLGYSGNVQSYIKQWKEGRQ